jgi:hypothetical protein
MMMIMAELQFKMAQNHNGSSLSLAAAGFQTETFGIEAHNLIPRTTGHMVKCRAEYNIIWDHLH